jgi:2-polyprenyl-3-methyl-5-hydroxy-6-metoxy-1,4-benzoquinol methylase
MNFTGERFISSLTVPEISYEHWHRYFFASLFVKDKTVLDISSGEGYGSYLLSKTARSVKGIDIDEESVCYANSKYKNSNLEFLIGSASLIPIKGENIFDVIISFETIEHIGEEQQKLFLGEVNRLLKDNGIFIVSSPNKMTYSDVPKFKNEFHIKELYVSEFNALLNKYFRHVFMLGQKVFASSYIWPENADKNTQLSEFLIEHTESGFVQIDREKESLYAIALCSKRAIKKQSFSLLVDLSERLIVEKNEHINSLTKRIWEVESLLQQRNRELTATREELQSVYSSDLWKFAVKLKKLAKKTMLIYPTKWFLRLHRKFTAK